MEIALFILAPLVALVWLTYLSISVRKPKYPHKQQQQPLKCLHNQTNVTYDYWFTQEIKITYCENCGKNLKTEHL